MFEKGKEICSECLNSIAFILVSMAGFLGFSFLREISYDKTMVVLAPICYGISGV